MIFVECDRDCEVKYGYAATNEHGAECSEFLSHEMCNSDQRSSAKYSYQYATIDTDPVLINGVLNKVSDAKNEDCDTNFVRKIFADKLFQIGVSFKEPRFPRL